MKTSHIISAALISFSSLLNAQESQTRNISPFQKLEVSGAVTVYYTHSDSTGLSIRARAGEIENVETRSDNGTLSVLSKGRFTGPVYVYIKNSQLRQVQASGASAFRSTNAIKADTISFNVSSSAQVNSIVNAHKVRTLQSGASLLTLSGSTDTFLAELSGASSLKAYNLVSKSTDILATGASSSKIYVTDKLKANASGASNIKIKGDVKDISAEANSASSITKVADKNHYTESDSIVYHWKNKKIIIVDKERDENTGDSLKEMVCTDESAEDDFKHWTGISFGVNGFMTSPGTIDIPAKYGYMDLNYGRSFNFQFNLFERQFDLVKNNVKIITGLGIDYHSYEFANKTNLNPDSSFTWGSIDSTNQYSYKKNRFRNTYVQVPLLIEFNTSNDPEKTFHIAFGVIGEYLIASRTKQVLERDKYEIKKVRKDSYNMSPFAAKAHVNFGYRGWTIYGEYNFTGLFQPGKGPELYPFSVGLRVIPFT